MVGLVGLWPYYFFFNEIEVANEFVGHSEHRLRLKILKKLLKQYTNKVLLY